MPTFCNALISRKKITFWLPTINSRKINIVVYKNFGHLFQYFHSSYAICIPRSIKHHKGIVISISFLESCKYVSGKVVIYVRIFTAKKGFWRPRTSCNWTCKRKVFIDKQIVYYVLGNKNQNYNIDKSNVFSTLYGKEINLLFLH